MKPSSFHFVALPSFRFQGPWLAPLYLLSEEKREECRGGFHRPGLEMHVTSSCISLSRAWSHGYARESGKHGLAGHQGEKGKCIAFLPHVTGK